MNWCHTQWCTQANLQRPKSHCWGLLLRQEQWFPFHKQHGISLKTNKRASFRVKRAVVFYHYIVMTSTCHDTIKRLTTLSFLATLWTNIQTSYIDFIWVSKSYIPMGSLARYKHQNSRYPASDEMSTALSWVFQWALDVKNSNLSTGSPLPLWPKNKIYFF